MRFAVLAAVLFLAAPVQAHDSWLSRNGLRNAAGEWCCGEGDCAVLDRGAARAVKGGFIVKGRGTIGEGTGAKRVSIDEFVPDAEAQPSPDGEFWRCQRPDGSRRCFFFPPPGT